MSEVVKLSRIKPSSVKLTDPAHIILTLYGMHAVKPSMLYEYAAPALLDVIKVRRVVCPSVFPFIRSVTI